MTVSKLLRIPTHVQRTGVSLEERQVAEERDPDIVDMAQTPDDVDTDGVNSDASASTEAASQDTGALPDDTGAASTEATGDDVTTTDDATTGDEGAAAASADDTATSADAAEQTNADDAGGDAATSDAADVGAATSSEATPPADNSTVDSGSDAANADLDNQADITPPEDVADAGLGDAATDTSAADAPPPVETPMDDIPEEALTSAWVQGVAVDTQHDVDEVAAGDEELADYEHNENELRTAATSLEELRDCCMAVVNKTHKETDDVSTPVQTEIVSEVSDKAVDLLTSGANATLAHVGSELDMPASMESASTPTERLGIALEAIDGKIKQIWETIKRLALQAWDAFVNFVKGIFDKAQRFRNQVANLRKFVVKFKGATPETSEFENNAVWAGCCVEPRAGQFEFSQSEVSKQFETYTSAAKPYLLNASKALVPGINMVFDKVAAIDPEKPESIDAMWNAFGALMNRYEKAVVMVTKMSGGERSLSAADVADGFRSTDGLLPIYSDTGLGGGGLATEIVDPKTDLQIAAKAFWTGASSYYLRGHPVVPSDAKVPTLTADQMEGLLDQIDDAMETIIDYRVVFDEFEKQLAKAQQATAKLASKLPEKEGTSTYQTILATMKLVPKLTKFNQAVITGLYVQSSSILQYIVASTKQYSTNDAAVESTANTVADPGAAKLPSPEAA